MTSSLPGAALALIVSTFPATSADNKTWYVYCEGAGQGDHWAVFSENFWPHPASDGYGRRVGSAAKAFFEARHDVQLDGCAAVDFVGISLAEHSRKRTAQLHTKMGDRVLYFPLPSEVLNEEPVVGPAVKQRHSAPEPEPQVTRQEPEPRIGMTPTQAER